MAGELSQTAIDSNIDAIIKVNGNYEITPPLDKTLRKAITNSYLNKVDGGSIVGTVLYTTEIVISDSKTLVHKKYVDDSIAAIVIPPTLTFDNGLTKTLNNVQLGGALVSNTTISGAFDFTFSGLNNFTVDSNNYLLTTDNGAFGESVIQLNNLTSLIGFALGGANQRFISFDSSGVSIASLNTGDVSIESALLINLLFTSGLNLNQGGPNGLIKLDNLTSNRTWQMPDNSGTFALLSDITGLVSDGNYGDITVSGAGTVWTINNNVITDAKISAHTSTKISITAKGQLNSAIVYNDQANTYGAFNQTFEDQRLRISNPANTFQYIITTSNIAANVNVNIPNLSANDTFVLENKTQTLASKTLTSPIINVGGDTTGDIYYRNAGAYTRLPIGTVGQVLTVAGGLPTWAAGGGGSGDMILASAQTNTGVKTFNNLTVRLTDVSNASFGVLLSASSSQAFTADRTLTIDLRNANRSLSLRNDFTTGDFATTLTTTALTNVTLPTSGTLYGTATGSITSAQLAASLTNETGTGTVVFNTSPTFATSVIGSGTMAVFNTTSTVINAFGASTTLNIGGTPTGAITHNYSTNATLTATTKTLNFGTAGASGSTTLINVGSSVAGAITRVNIATATSTAFLNITSGTTTQSSARLIQTTTANIPTTPNTGDIYHQDINGLIFVTGNSTNILREKLVGCIFTQTNTQTVSNTVAETTIIGTGSVPTNTKTIPANFLNIGTVIRIRLRGYYSTTGSPTLTVQCKLGATQILTTFPQGAALNANNRLFDVMIELSCRTTGGTGTIMGWGKLSTFSTSAILTTSTEIVPNAGIGTTVTIDTTASQAIDVTATWGTASASNNINTIESTIEIL